MRILLCADACPQTTAFFYERALRAEGHEVVTLGPLFTADDVDEWRNAEEQNTVFPGSGRHHRWRMLERLPQHRDIETQPSAEPYALAGAGGCDLVLWIDSGLHRLTLDLTGCTAPTVALVGDVRGDDVMGRQIQHARQFDLALLQFTPGAVKRFVAAGVNAQWIPPCADPDQHAWPGDVTPIYDVGLVGSTTWAHDRRVSLLKQMQGAGIDVRVESHLHEEMALFHQRCRVLFNCSLDGDLNMRVPEAMISGRPLVTDRVEGIATFGQHDTRFLLYDTDDEAVAAVQSLLHCPGERARIGGHGHALARCQHTYGKRVAEILERAEG